MLTVRRSLPRIVPLQHVWRPSDWPNASLYCLLARAVHLNPALSGGLPNLFGLTTRSSEPLRRMKGQGSSLVRHLLEQEIDIDHRMGKDINVGSGRDLPMLHVLRYCPECLRLGYHSTLFQYLGLASCPEHKCLLQVRCAACANEVVPTLQNTASDPFACPKCKKSFVSSVAAEREGGALKALDQTLGGMRTWQSERAEFKPPSRHLTGFAPAEAAKVARRFTCWHGSHLWGRFREERWPEGRIPSSEELGDTAVEAGTRAALNALRQLCQDCSEFVDQAKALRWRVGAADSGVKLEGRASAIAAALCKTGYVLRADVALLNPDSPCYSTAAQHRLASYINQDISKVSTAGFARLRELEVLALFADYLVEAAKARYLKGFSWAHEGLEGRLIATWCRQHDPDGTLFLRIRPRIDEAGVARLIRRYRAHALASEHDDYR
jgi:hypothetical protein